VGVEGEQIRSLGNSDQPDHYGGEKETEPNPLAPTESHAANLPVSLIALANARRREAGFRLCGQSEPEPARSAPTAAAYRSQAPAGTFQACRRSFAMSSRTLGSGNDRDDPLV